MNNAPFFNWQLTIGKIACCPLPIAYCIKLFSSLEDGIHCVATV